MNMQKHIEKHGDLWRDIRADAIGIIKIVLSGAVIGAVCQANLLQPAPALASGPTVPVGAEIGTVFATGAVDGADAAGVTVTDLVVGNWYTVASTAGAVNVYAAGPALYTCAIQIDDYDGEGWIRDAWAVTPWVSRQESPGPCRDHATVDWWAYDRFWFQAQTPTLSIRAYDGFYPDNSGSLTYTINNVIVNTDNTPPVTQATLTCTQGGNGWCRGSATLTLSAADPAGPNGATPTGVAATYFNSDVYNGSAIIDAEGVSPLSFYSVDQAGNAESPKTLTVQIDALPPTSAITSHTDNQAVAGVLNLSGTASDATSGIDFVEVALGCADYHAASGTTDWSDVLDTRQVTDGSHAVCVRALDKAGNLQETPTKITLRVDNSPPMGTLTSAASFCPGCGETLPIVYAANDGSGAGLASWSLEAVEPGLLLASGSSAPPAGSVFNWDGGGLAPGKYTLHLRVTDQVGHTTEAAQSVTLLAPIRTVTGQAIHFPVTMLTGVAQTIQADPPAAAWTVENTYPPGTGWQVQIALSDLSDGSHLIPASQLKMRIQASAITGQAAATANPTSWVTAYTALSTQPHTILSATEAVGIGTYQFTPEFTLTVPAQAVAGTYRATVTLTIVAGP